MTRRNDHAGAKVAGAKALWLKKLEKIFGLIKEIARHEGHMPSYLDKYSYDLYQQMMGEAKKKLSPEHYKAFYAAF